MEQKQHPLIDEFKKSLFLSSPLVASWIIISLSPFVATMFVAYLGHEALAATALMNSLWVMVQVFMYGLFNVITVLISHQYGAKNYPVIGKIVRHGILVALFLSIPMMLSLAAAPYFLHDVVQDHHIIALANMYVHSLVWAIPTAGILIVLEDFYNGIGKTYISFWVSSISIPIEIVLIYIFVFGKLGSPAYGIKGVGYGLSASYLLTSIGLMLFIYFSKFAKPYAIFEKIWSFELKYFMEIIRLGFPIGLMFLIEVGAISVASILMARFGTVALAAQQLAMQFLGVTINIPYALGQAVAIRIGMNAGQQNRKGVFNACNVGVIMSISLMAIIAIFYIFFPRLLIKIDLNLHDPNNLVLIKQTSSFLIILGVFQLFDCIRIIAVSVLRALKDTKFALYISIISFWLIGISVGLILSMYFHMRGEGIWIGLCLGVIFGAIVLIIRAYRKLSHINLKELVVL